MRGSARAYWCSPGSPGWSPGRWPWAPVTFAIVLAALALAGWVAARIARVRPLLPMVRTAGIGALAMLITYGAGLVIRP